LVLSPAFCPVSLPPLPFFSFLVRFQSPFYPYAVYKLACSRSHVPSLDFPRSTSLSFLFSVKRWTSPLPFFGLPDPEGGAFFPADSFCHLLPGCSLMFGRSVFRFLSFCFFQFNLFLRSPYLYTPTTSPYLSLSPDSHRPVPAQDVLYPGYILYPFFPLPMCFPLVCLFFYSPGSPLPLCVDDLINRQSVSVITVHLESELVLCFSFAQFFFFAPGIPFPYHLKFCQGSLPVSSLVPSPFLFFFFARFCHSVFPQRSLQERYSFSRPSFYSLFFSPFCFTWLLQDFGSHPSALLPSPLSAAAFPFYPTALLRPRHIFQIH